jgi:hypothetical protein
MSSTYADIVLYLVNWLSPEQMPDIYALESLESLLPSKLLYAVRLAKIRWSLKEGRVEESERVKDWVVEHINRWIGDCHPILTELYEIYANYYLMLKNQEKKAVNYCKTAIKNQKKILGQNHHRLADSYYLLGTVYRNFGRK